LCLRVVDGVNFYTQEGVRALFGLVVRVVGKVFSLIFLCWQFEKEGKVQFTSSGEEKENTSCKRNQIS
jgi:hypothetical protein